MREYFEWYLSQPKLVEVVLFAITWIILALISYKVLVWISIFADKKSWMDVGYSILDMIFSKFEQFFSPKVSPIVGFFIGAFCVLILPIVLYVILIYYTFQPK